MSSGQVVAWLTVSCGSCDNSEAYEVVGDKKRRDAVNAFRANGWQTEKVDATHSRPWWICPTCLET